MKKLFLILALGFSFVALRAQERELEINYFAHDHFNESILNALDNLFQTNAFNKNKQTYFYLANAESPLILKVDRDKQNEFEEFRYAINSQLKHNVWPEVDIQKILELLQEDDFINDFGEPRYDFFTLNFYTTPSFWSYSYNETLIARLFWDLDLASKSNFQMNIYHPENDGMQYDDNRLFGPKKLTGDYQVYLYTY